MLIVSDKPQGAPPDPSMPPAPPLKHNIILLRNTAAGTSSVALFISPEIRKISLLLLLLQCPTLLFLLCTLSSMVTPSYLMLFYRLSVYMLRLLCSALSFLLPGFQTATVFHPLTQHRASVSGCLLCYLSHPPLLAIQSVTVM